MGILSDRPNRPHRSHRNPHVALPSPAVPAGYITLLSISRTTGLTFTSYVTAVSISLNSILSGTAGSNGGWTNKPRPVATANSLTVRIQSWSGGIPAAGNFWVFEAASVSIVATDPSLLWLPSAGLILP